MPKNHPINKERVFVLRENRVFPIWRGLLLVILMIALPAATWWAAAAYLGEQNRELQLEIRSASAEVSAMNAQVDELRQQRADLEVASQLDKEAIQQLRNRLVDWRESNEQLEAQTQFYMSLMNPASDNAGIFIESIEIQSASTPGQYDYDVLVAQRTLDHQRVIGRLMLSVEGTRDGQSVIMLATDLGQESDGQTLGFRYFQHLTGRLTLPDDFEPESLRARVILTGSTVPIIDEIKAWTSS